MPCIVQDVARPLMLMYITHVDQKFFAVNLILVNDMRFPARVKYSTILNIFDECTTIFL